jgi:hypothetical protein
MAELDLGDLELFDRRAVPYFKRPQVTIQAGGALSVNASAQRAIGAPSAVELLYGRRQNVIVFRPASEESKDAYPLRAQGANATTYIVTAKSFLTHYGIPFGIAKRYDAEIVDGMLVVDLNQEGVVALSNRQKAQQRAESNGAANEPA